MSDSKAVLDRLKTNKASSLVALGLMIGGAIGTVGMIASDANPPAEAISTQPTVVEPTVTQPTVTEPSASGAVRLRIGPETTTCNDWYAAYECPVMSIDGSSWSAVFGGDVEGLDYELGVEYVVDAELRQRDPGIADLGSSYYEVIRVIERSS